MQQSPPLAHLATRNEEALRRKYEERLLTDYRLPFSVDTDRILNSLAYTRYIDKTQVFSLIRNDHLTHRVLHVQLVSKIGRTIGRVLGLNEDLIEAIALGHDIGHPPFGHDGESFLSKICLSCGIGTFQHNAQSVQFLDRVERNGKGWNLSLQTLDGILCHDGEIHNTSLVPQGKKDFSVLDQETSDLFRHPEIPVMPMTYEGCVMRMSDTIAYIGRDMEDAIRLGLISRKDLPENIAAVLGNTNGTIVYTLVTDLITQSSATGEIAFTPEVSEALYALKQFNYNRIYLNPAIKVHLKGVEGLFHELFGRCMDDLARENGGSPIFSLFLSDKEESYRKKHRDAEIVRDFIAGMTDHFFLEQFPEEKRPKTLFMAQDRFPS